MPGPLVVAQHIAAPAETVWAIITDLDNASDVISGIDRVELLSPAGPFGVGTKWRETRTMFGKSATEVMEVTAVEPGRSYETRAEHGSTVYTSSMSVTPDGTDTCTLTMRFDAETSGFLNRTLGAVMGRLMVGTVKKTIAKDLSDIAAAATTGN